MQSSVELEMLEKYQEAPDESETNASVAINWERVRDAPLVGINGIIDWNQLERERLLGVEAEHTWSDEVVDAEDNVNEDNENESFWEYEAWQYDDDGNHEGVQEGEFDVIEWMEVDDVIEMILFD